MRTINSCSSAAGRHKSEAYSVDTCSRLCSESWFVCQNIRSQSYSAALCVMRLALLSSGLQISIHPARVAFKLLLEPFCFVTHNNLMDYYASLSSKIYPIFKLLLTCYSVLFSSLHIAETVEGFANIAWPWFWYKLIQNHFLTQFNFPVSHLWVSIQCFVAC